METGLDGKRKFLALVMLLIFLLSFTLSPFPELNSITKTGGVPL
jgi:hypothetical protein